ncbi:MAG: EamA family transporter [Acidobacteriota bacterium]
MKGRELAAYAALCMIWSTTWVAIRIGVRYLPPFGFAAARFLIASALLGAILLWRPPRSSSDSIPWASVVLTGVLQFGVSYGLVFWGEQYVAAGFASIIFASIPLFIALIARVMLGERLYLPKVIGILVGFSGILLLFLRDIGDNPGDVWAGVGLVAGAIASSFANVLIQRDQRDLDQTFNAAFQMILGTVCLFGMSAIAEPGAHYRWTPASIASLLFLALFGSTIAFLLYYWLLHRTTAMRASTIAFVAPLLTVIQGHVFLGEVLGWNHLIGGVLILVGSAMVIRQRSR